MIRLQDALIISGLVLVAHSISGLRGVGLVLLGVGLGMTVTKIEGGDA